MFDVILRRTENAIISISFAAITLLAFANVVSRYLLHGSLAFTSELLVNLAVLLTLVGASAAVRLGTHPDFSVLKDITKGVPHQIVIVVIGLAMLTFYLLFLWMGMDMVMKQQAMGRVTPALGIPQWILSLSLPFGATLGAIRSIQVCILNLRPKTVETAELLPGA